jgi:glucokinase
MMTEKILVADIGGTHARFALTDAGGRPKEAVAWLTSLYPDPSSALKAFLDQLGAPTELAGVAICAAGPVEADVIRLTNCPWIIDRRAISTALNVSKSLLVNDFAAFASVLPRLKGADCVSIGPQISGDDTSPRVVIGPGTGLGVAALITNNERSVVISGEGGHTGLAPSDAREISIIFQLLQEFGRASAERVLSGPGLENLYAAIVALDGVAAKARLTAVDIAGAAKRGDVVATEVVERFSGWLGDVAGDMALAFGAKGGVYIGGGIVPLWGNLFRDDIFRRRFEAKGRMRSYMNAIPTKLITAKDASLWGLSALAADAFDD